MKNHMVWRIWTLVALLSLSLALFVGCAERRAPESVMDTPEHHVFNGMRSFEKGQLGEAQAEFELALELEPKYGPAHVGMGLVQGAKSVGVQSEEEKEKYVDGAFDSLKKGKRYAEGKDQVVQAYVGYIRVYTMIKEKGWLDDAEDNLDYAVARDKEASAPYYYMGEAYKQAYEFNEAAHMYRKVLDLDKEFTAEADKSWELVQKIQRAAPGTTVGKQIALVEAITRADVAALFVQELKLEEIYEKLSIKSFDTSFKAPKSALKMETETVVKLPPATDIEDHVLRHDVDTVTRIGVRGLEPYPDHTFRPDEQITRAAYAMMLEDILVKATRDEALATRFFGTTSPYPDLRNDLPYFNAVMVCTSRGIMTPIDVRTGEFQPLGTVSGADALLAIRVLKEQLKLL
ncbi:MAG: S-layer homology domain-containing protein [Deltaproteobacteria bacterium]|nr:MAG: S-layer homology domain-containing protein [Deltaproteobacteria bacterium]